ncbi:MAG: hypothetical protein OEW19_20170 [Acidobacteriota bacterium]|nr:hypothetical protein [Acidobacteriota bacterium]
MALAPVAGSRPASTPPATDTARPPDARFLNQWRSGRDARELARTWYLTPQGSPRLDFDMLTSIARSSDDALFSARENLESYGFLCPNNYEEIGIRQANLPNGLALSIRQWTTSRQSRGSSRWWTAIRAVSGTG